MPVDGPLPKTGDQQDIDADANRCLWARSPRHWRMQNLAGTDDYGFDYQVQTTPNQQATDIFRLQLKGTRSPEISAGRAYISITLKASTVRYYDRAVEPVLLVICDLSVDPTPSECPLYYVWVRAELHRINIAELPVEQKYVTLRAPLSNRLTEDTDLSEDIRYQNDLSRVGYTLSSRAEQTHPGMQTDDRLNLVQGAMKGIAARGATFIDALAASTEQHWVAPSPGTLAWNLNQAKTDLGVNALERAAHELNIVESKLEQATDLELAEYWCLRGNWEVESGFDQAASLAYQKAYKAKKLPKYVAAWVEAELRLRFQDDPESLQKLHELLVGDDPVILATKSRLYAVQDEFQSALEVASSLPEPQRSFARAFAHWLSGDYKNTLADCELGLTVCNTSHDSKHLLLLLKARAKFMLAHATSALVLEEVIPASGLPGVDYQELLGVWEAVSEAVAALRSVGWDSNIEQLADIWVATASALGKAETILPDLIEGTRTRPRLKSLQEALRTVASQTGHFEIALAANDRLPESDDKATWSALLLYEVGKYRLCWQGFRSCFDTLNRQHPLFGPAVLVASLSAHKMAQPTFVKQWIGELEAHPDLGEHAALAHYYLALEVSKLSKDEALRSLQNRYEELDRPHSLAMTLLQELDPTDAQQALVCVQVSSQITQHALLSPAMAAHLGLALVTLKDWQALVDLCQSNRIRAEADDRMAGFEALALDHLGHTEKARDRLSRLLSTGSDDRLALNTYVTIATRCGYIDEAVEAAERVLEAADTKKEKLDCLSLLFALIQFAAPSSGRLLALADQFGDLADQNVENQEGSYLLMRLASTLVKSDIDLASDREEFRKRADVFFEKFPNSQMLRRGEINPDASAAELVASLKSFLGVTEDREAFQNRLEHGLQQGFTVIPFSWRPRFALSSICDVVHLWETAKLSSRDDLKYHLTMLSDPNWHPSTADVLRSHVPLLDWTALLVLFDLDLIGSVVDFFGTIAISKATMEELAEFTNPFYGSPMRGKCLNLQQALKPHLSSILQPSSSGPMHERSERSPVGRGNTEIIEICAQTSGRFRLYSDDFAFRFFCAGGGKSNGICTLDVLAALVEAGLLSSEEKAHKIAQLCEWRVGVVVQLPDLVQLLPPALLSAKSVRHGGQILDADHQFVSMISALWDYRSPFERSVSHAAAVLRYLAEQTAMPAIGLAAFLNQWFVKAAMKKDAPPQAVQTLTRLISESARHGHLSKPHARRIWFVYMSLVESHHGDHMDELREKQAIQLLGAQCARLQVTEPGVGQHVYVSLNAGLTEDTSEQSAFSSGYSAALISLKNSSRRH